MAQRPLHPDQKTTLRWLPIRFSWDDVVVDTDDLGGSLDLHEIFQRAKQREAEDLAASETHSSCGVCFFSFCRCDRKLPTPAFDDADPTDAA